MMIATENPEAASALLARYRDTRPPRDTSAPHASDLLGCTRLAWWRRNHPSADSTFTDDTFTLLTMLGEGHHQLVGGGTEKEKSRFVDGILLTPDEEVWECKDGEPRRVIVEYKTTRISAARQIHEMSTYTDQLGAYCSFLGTPHGRLHVFHLVGNGRYPNTTPVHRCWDVEFGERELAWWRKELIRRRVLLESAQSLWSIPLAEHREWECKYADGCPLLRSGTCPGGGGERLPAFPNVVLK